MSSEVQEILDSSFENIRLALDNGAVTSVQLTEEVLHRSLGSQKDLNSYISFCEDRALAEAKAADERLSRGERGPCLGVPFAIKDLICAKNTRTTAASRMLENFLAPYDATVVEKSRKAGLALVGKLNLDEFAMGSSNEKSFFGPVKNPWDLSRVSGGSSGGSAAAVAARSVPLTLGTDTGGSVRQPSSFCGVTGIKPTYGRVSRYGVIAFASSLDQVGTLAADAPGAAALLEVISGRDLFDATSSDQNVPSFYKETLAFRDQNKIKGLRIGLPEEFFSDSLGGEVKKAIDEALLVFKAAGAQCVPVKLPHTHHSLAAYYITCTSEASSNLARYDGIHYGYRSPHLKGGDLLEVYKKSRAEAFGEEVKLRIMLGTYALSSGYYDAFYNKAAKVRRLIKKDFEEAFTKCDVIAGPTSPFTAFRLGEKSNDPLAMYLADIYTLSTNLAALPALSFNVGFDSMNLPIGLQLIGPWWRESDILGVAATYQKIIPSSVKVAPNGRAI